MHTSAALEECWNCHQQLLRRALPALDGAVDGGEVPVGDGGLAREEECVGQMRRELSEQCLPPTLVITGLAARQ